MREQNKCSSNINKKFLTQRHGRNSGQACKFVAKIENEGAKPEDKTVFKHQKQVPAGLTEMSYCSS